MAATVDAQRCLRQGKPFVSCTSCQDACPAGAVTAAGRSVRIGAECLGCGQCAVVCPAGAVAVAGFEAPQQRPAAAQAEIVIDCLRAPPEGEAEAEPDEVWRVPCVRGLDVTVLAPLLADAARPRLLLRNRGWCGDCAAAGGEPAMQATRDRLQAAFDRAAPGRVRVAVAALPLPPARATPAGRPPPRSRRALFRRLLAATPPPPLARGRLAERSLLAALAEQAGRAEAPLYPAVALGSACADHGLCAATCPTGALRRTEAEDGLQQSLVFEPARCIECGRCAAICPERALGVLPDRVAVAAAATPRTLRERRLAACERCDAPFRPGDPGQILCPACVKDRALFADLFGRGRAAAQPVPSPASAAARRATVENDHGL